MSAVFLPLAIIALVGALLAHALPGMEEARRNVNLLVLYVFLPALVFRTIMNASANHLFVAIPLAAATGVLACLAVAFLVFHFLPIPGETKGAMMLGAAFGNVTYLGLPVLLGIFPGRAADVAEVAVLFEVSKSSLNLTLGAMIAIGYGSREPITFRKTGLEALKLPPHLGAGRGAGLEGVAGAVPGLRHGRGRRALRGGQRHDDFIPGHGAEVPADPPDGAGAAGGGDQAGLLALVGFPRRAAAGIGGLFGQATILEAAMPSQLLSFVIAGRFKLDEETLAFVIMADTILAFITLPLVHAHLAAPS
ncbi:MAG: AEC family transporter [Verrucomicrobiota bacterium]